MSEPLTDPVDVLFEEIDPVKRAVAHLALGRAARDDNQIERAIRHFSEALALDPDAVEARRELHSLGRLVNPAAIAARGRSLLGRFWRSSGAGGA